MWALRSVRQARHQLASGSMAEVRLPPVRQAALTGHDGIVSAVCHLAGATCLESALVRQQWAAAHGDRRKVIVGVTSPSDGFEAHAWLDGEPTDPRFVVIDEIGPVSAES